MNCDLVSNQMRSQNETLEHLRSIPRNYRSYICISYRETEWPSHPGHQGLLEGRGRAARTRSHCIISKGQVGLWR